jgi:hypothetical protein
MASMLHNPCRKYAITIYQFGSKANNRSQTKATKSPLQIIEELATIRPNPQDISSAK